MWGRTPFMGHMLFLPLLVKYETDSVKPKVKGRGQECPLHTI
jgi:hypothetical protein